MRDWYKKGGPRSPHKIQNKVLDFLRAQLSPDEPIRAHDLAKLLLNEFGLTEHPRTIERAVGGNLEMTSTEARSSTNSSAILAQHETLCSAMVGEALPPEAHSGLIAFLHQGTWGWACTLTAPTVRQEPMLARSSTATEPFERRAGLVADAT